MIDDSPVRLKPALPGAFFKNRGKKAAKTPG